MKSSDLFKHLPSVNELLENPQLKSVVDRLNRSTVTTRVRNFLDELKEEVTQRADDLPSLREVVDRVARYVTQDGGWQLKAAVNATGQFRGQPWIATPLGDAAAERVLLLSKDFATESNDQLLQASDAVAALTRLTGAEAAAVFHSRAGALSLILTELADEPPVVIARGELGEIDPGCRFTELCNMAGARMQEVGATDVVTPEDYANALQENTGFVLRLAPEGFRMVGGAPRPTTAEVARVTHAAGRPLVEDLASGPLVELSAIEGITSPSAKDAIAAGADLVLTRGDGIVAGPACCIVLGKRDLVDRLATRPLAAAHRSNAATVAALAATLEELDDPQRAALRLPLLSLLATPLENLQTRAQRLAPQITQSPAVATADVVELSADAAVVSGLPFAAPTVAIAVTPATDNQAGASVESLTQALADATPSVHSRVEGEQLLLDLRTVFPRQDLAIVSAFPPAEGEGAVNSGDAEPIGG